MESGASLVPGIAECFDLIEQFKGLKAGSAHPDGDASKEGPATEASESQGQVASDDAAMHVEVDDDMLVLNSMLGHKREVSQLLFVTVVTSPVAIFVL